MAGTMFAARADAMFAALASQDFAYYLEAGHGLAVGPVLGEEPPAAPYAWVDHLFDFAEQGGPTEPLEAADARWGRAFRAGREAANRERAN